MGLSEACRKTKPGKVNTLEINRDKKKRRENGKTLVPTGSRQKTMGRRNK